MRYADHREYSFQTEKEIIILSKHRRKNREEKTLTRLLEFCRPYIGQIIAALIFAIIYVGLNLVAPILVGYAIDYAVGVGKVDFVSVGLLLLGVGVSAVCSGVFQWLMNMCTNTVVYFTVRDIRRLIYKKWSTVPLSVIDRTPHGDLISRMINDADSVGDGLMQGITQLFSGIVMIICTLVFMMYISVTIAIAVVIITPLSMFVAAFITKISRKQFMKQSEVQGEISSYIDEYIGQQKLVKSFGYEERSMRSFEEINERLRICGQKSQWYSSLANPSTRFVNNLVTSAVTILGSLSVIGGTMTVGSIATFITYANQYTKPFNEVTGVIPQIQAAMAGARRIFEFLDSEDMSEDPENSEENRNLSGNIDIDHVNFSYVPTKKLITDFNLHVSSGQRIAIVGPTGCGKTTLINLLMRFYDINSGSIKIDGKSIYQMSRHDLRSNYGMVLQESWLYNASIRDNIAYGRPDADIEDVIAAAKKAHIHNFIQRLPDGYDTIVTEDGTNLSQGQRQLICIARVMLCDPPMLILDEATSSIDTRTELRVQKAFAEMMKGRTSFIVAHRLSTIKEADVILVMKDGNIIEQGDHNSLMKAGGFYSNLYNSQFAVAQEG